MRDLFILVCQSKVGVKFLGIFLMIKSAQKSLYVRKVVLRIPTSSKDLSSTKEF